MMNGCDGIVSALISYQCHYWHIEVCLKWSPYQRRHFQMNLMEKCIDVPYDQHLYKMKLVTELSNVTSKTAYPGYTLKVAIYRVILRISLSIMMSNRTASIMIFCLLAKCHDDVIKWKHFPRYWSFVRGIHRSRWIPRTKASDAELWCFLWSASE